MAKLYNIARMATTTTGTGTLTLGSAVFGYIDFATAGVSNGDVVTYVIEEGSNREIGRGTYTSAGTTLSRDTVLKSTNAGAKINLAGAAQVFITAAAEDIEQAASDTQAGRVELATDAEAITGTDTSRALTPANLAAAAGKLVQKTSDTSRSSTTTTTADPALQFSMQANTKYVIEITIIYSTGATPDFKWGLSGPASPTSVNGAAIMGTPPTSGTLTHTTFTAYPTNVALATVDTGVGLLKVTLAVLNGANTATFSFDWAQNSSSATAAIVKAGSYLTYRTFT
jgi:hypothetical protein